MTSFVNCPIQFSSSFINQFRLISGKSHGGYLAVLSSARGIAFAAAVDRNYGNEIN